MKKIYKNNSLSEQGITTQEELQKRLQEIFEQSDHQNSALIGVYKLVLPDWDNIKEVDGFPEVGKELWKHICNLFIDFDRQHHPNVFHGGIWLNNGFSSNDRLEPWEISLENCNLIYA